MNGRAVVRYLRTAEKLIANLWAAGLSDPEILR